MRSLHRALLFGRRLLFHTVAGVISMCAGVCSGPSTPSLFRLPAVPGFEPTRSNDLLLCPAGESGEKPHHVVYFPGDVQNYREIMASHSENFRWKRWSLEDVAAILSQRFPTSYIWIIKSSRMHLHKFSCYDNFVECNMFGAPKHSSELRAFQQLHSLLVNAFTVAQNVLISQSNKYGVHRDCDLPDCDTGSLYSTNSCPSHKENVIHSAINFGIPSIKDSLSITLIGFSKGCVVLNQLLHEMQAAKKDKGIKSFLANIKSMYWLDGGHSGGIDTWITSPELLKVFSQTGIAVHTHVTPYQVRDAMRSWIGEEHRKFVHIMKDYNVTVESQLHFSYEIPSLDNHFRVHEVF
ncbi:mitochondrial protein C2orf69 homolog [Rhinophrynus dorsalis]